MSILSMLDHLFQKIQKRILQIFLKDNDSLENVLSLINTVLLQDKNDYIFI